MGLMEAQSYYRITASAQDSVADLPPRSMKCVGQVLVSGVLGHSSNTFGKYNRLFFFLMCKNYVVI